MHPTLSFMAGVLKGEVRALTEPTITIGREPSNNLSIPSRRLSRNHCRLNAEGDSYVIVDLGSQNGTLVNGTPVKERLLRHGDLIEAGDVVFLFELPHVGATPTSEGQVQWLEEPLNEATAFTIARESALDWNFERLHQLSLNARLARQFQAVLKIGLELNQLQAPEAIEQRLLDSLREVVPAQRGLFLILEGDEWVTGSNFGWGKVNSSAAALSVSRTIVQRVTDEAVSLLYHRVQTHSDLQAAHSLLYAGVQSVMAVPLATQEKVFGILYLDTRDETERFDDWHLQLVTALANLTAYTLQRARELKRIKEDRLRLQAELSGMIVGESQSMCQIRERVEQFGRAEASVLILGESGTGKEVIARALHETSPRANQPFVAINCAAIPDSLMESELFGHEKGAFTGANHPRKGKFEMADGGTLFLDEIGEMRPDLQAKLLRVIEERCVDRIGGNKPVKVDIRVIAATNRDLAQAIKEGRFREDLFYRLNVFLLTLPPLRERREDIEALARFFLGKCAHKAARVIHDIAQDTIACLRQYHWPGNVRELRNAIEHSVILNNTGTILPEDLPAHIYEANSEHVMAARLEDETAVSALLPATNDSAAPLTYREAVKAARKSIVLNAFKLANNNHQAAAKILGLHPNNLHRELRSLNLRDELK